MLCSAFVPGHAASPRIFLHALRNSHGLGHTNRTAQSDRISHGSTIALFRGESSNCLSSSGNGSAEEHQVVVDQFGSPARTFLDRRICSAQRTNADRLWTQKQFALAIPIRHGELLPVRKPLSRILRPSIAHRTKPISASNSKSTAHFQRPIGRLPSTLTPLESASEFLLFHQPLCLPGMLSTECRPAEELCVGCDFSERFFRPLLTQI